jgi:hypothetical protein
VAAIVGQVAAIVKALEQRRRRPGITVKLSPFVPKAQTPFQGVAMLSLQELDERVSLVKRGLRRIGVTVKADSPQWAAVEAVLARGDRRVAAALEATSGASWSDWQAALESVGLRASQYLGERSPTDLQPWDSVSTGVKASYLHGELARAQRALLTRPCPPAESRCVRCGVCSPDSSADIVRQSEECQVNCSALCR